MKMRKWLLGLTIGLGAALSGVAPRPAGADQVDLDAVADNTLYESASGSLSNGAGQHFLAGENNDGRIRRGVIRFDVAGIPAGSVVTGVQLRLQMSRTQGGTVTVSLHRLLADWGEGISDAGGEEGGGTSATSGDATWLHRSFNTVNWAAAGGDFAPTASATAPVAGTGPYTWGSTPALVADVQDWLDGVAANNGWIVIGSEGGTQTAKRFDSRTNPTAANRPLLSVTFTPPVVGACCDAGGGCAEVAPAACPGTYQGDATRCGAGGTCGACCDGASCAPAIAARCTDYRGDGSSCAPDPCQAPVAGACCLGDGSCSEVEAQACTGSFQGNGTSCGAGLTCGACCDGASCSLRIASTCTGSYQGDGSACAPDPCPPPQLGACCQADGSCREVEAAACTGSFQGNGTSCGAGLTCGACCDGASCSLRLASTCAGSYQGDGAGCSPDACGSRTGACCQRSSCSDGIGASDCRSQGGEYQGDGQSCSTDPCGDDSRACCFSDGRCVVMNRDDCDDQGGDRQGGGSTCAENPCAPSGACCLGSTCAPDMTEDACEDLGGDYQGGVPCAPDPCAGAPCDVGLIRPLARLLAVRRNAGRDVFLSWNPDANATGYNTWTVPLKRDIPSANGSGPASAVPGCSDRPGAACLHVAAVSPAAGLLLYYNVIGACAGVEAPR